MATTYEDFDPWGMEGNTWGGYAGTDNWDLSNIGANTGLDTEWNPDTTMWNTVSYPQGNLPQQQVNAPQYTGINIGGPQADSWYTGLDNNFGRPNLGLQGYENFGPANQLKESLASGYPMQYSYNLKDNYPPAEQMGPQEPTMGDQVRSGVGKLSDFLGKNKDLLRGVMGMYGAYKNQQQADMQRKLASQMMSQFGNPYAKEYAAGHRNYYLNPGEFYNSPVVQTQLEQTMDPYMRQMAAQGRTNPNEIAYQRAKTLRDITANTYLPWMQQSYPWGQENANLIGPYSQLMSGANQAEYNKYGGILEALLRMSGMPQESIGTTTNKEATNPKETFTTFLKSVGLI